MAGSCPPTPDLSDEFDEHDAGFDEVAAAEVANAVAERRIPEAVSIPSGGGNKPGGSVVAGGDGGGFMPEEMVGGGFIPENMGDGGFMPQKEVPWGDDSAGFEIQKPSGRCAEYRVVPRGGFITRKEFAGAAQTPGQAGGASDATGAAGEGASGVEKPKEPQEVACKECGELGVNRQLWDTFTVAVCRACSEDDDGKGPYKLMTKTKAKVAPRVAHAPCEKASTSKGSVSTAEALCEVSRDQEEFLLPDSCFEELPFLKKKNPRKDGWNDMKLFMRSQLREACLQKWGNMDEARRGEQLEKERERRRQAAFDLGVAKVKRKAGEGLGILMQQRGAKTISGVEAAMADDGEHGLGSVRKPKAKAKKKAAKVSQAPVARHEHRWGDESWDETKNMWQQSCVECGITTTFEKF